jgi:CheY-like chemotaxis protein
MKTPNQRTILWADDDPDDLDMMHDVLKDIDHNFNIVEVHNGRKVLDHLHAIKQPEDFPCLVVLDMNMPVLSGRETLVRLKKDPRFNILNIVMFTTSNSPLDQTFCRQYGVEMITKPPSLNSLRQTVSHLLSHCL